MSHRPRADLLAEAASPAPRFAAVICQNIERSGRDTYYALQLEKQLTLAGIPLFATDEPIDVAGANASLVRQTHFVIQFVRKSACFSLRAVDAGEDLPGVLIRVKRPGMLVLASGR